MTSHHHQPTDTDGFYLDRPGQHELRDLLGQVPGVVEDLAVTIARQDRVGRGGRGRPGRLSASPMPVNIAASGVRDDLRALLADWVRRTCTARQLDFEGADDILGLARWLRRWLIAVALTEGADELVPDLAATLRQCRRTVDLPPDPVAVDQWRAKQAEDQARAMELPPAGIRDLGKALGAPYSELTSRRLKYLRAAKKLTPRYEVRTGGRQPIPVYRVGDAVDAHLGICPDVPSA